MRGAWIEILICREFNVNETWLRTGEGEMFAETPSGTLDALAREYHLDRFGRAVVEKMLNLNEKQWAVFRDFAMDVLESLSESPTALTGTSEAEPTAPDSGKDIQVPTTVPVVLPGDTSRAKMEAEARAEAEEYYQEILEEKRRAAESSASQSDTDAKMA